MLADNPIIGKELKSLLRSRRAFVLALVYVLVLSAVVLTMCPTEGATPDVGGRSRQIFAAIVVTQMAMLLLFAPPLAATAITTEKDARTYESLYCTHLSAADIVFGKIAGALGYMLILVVLSLPVAGMSLALGGVGRGELFLAYAILVAAGLLFALVGVAVSALARRSFSALVATYGLLITICGVVQLPALFLGMWKSKSGQLWLFRAQCCSPFSALLAVTRHIFDVRGPDASRVAVLWFFGFFLVAATVFLLLAVIGARRSAQRPPRKRQTAIGREAPLRTWLLRRLIFLVDPRRRRTGIPLFVNPVLILEFRTRTTSLTNVLRALFACIILSIGLMILIAGDWGVQRVDVVRLIAVSIQFGLIVLLAPSLTVGAVSSEIENKTFDQMRMTPVGPLRMLVGKLGAALAYGVLLWVAVLPVFLAIMFIREHFAFDEFRAVAAVAGSSVLVAVAVGLFFSTVCRRTATAAALTYGFMGFLVVATALAAVVGERLHPQLAQKIVALNPVIAAVSVVSDVLFARWEIWQTNVVVMLILSGIAILGSAWRLRQLVEPSQ